MVSFQQMPVELVYTRLQYNWSREKIQIDKGPILICNKKTHPSVYPWFYIDICIPLKTWIEWK